MKKKVWIIVGVASLIAILVGANVYRAMSAESPEVKTVNLKEREITANVMVPGTLQFQEEEYIFNEPEKGTIAEILVKEGDTVEKGTPLLKYENEQLTLEKEQNALSIESGYLRINQLKDQIEDLDEKEKDLKDQVGEKEAEKQIDTERSQLEMDLKVADIELRQTLLQKETIAKKMEELVVKSHFAGTVLSVDEEAASNKSEVQKHVLHIGDPNKLVVKGVLSEYDALKVKKDQPVKVRSDVIPDKEWNGKVTTVGMLPEQTDPALGDQNQAVQYPIEVSIDTKDLEAKPGFKLIMEVETEKRTASSIPVEAVKQENDSYFVYVAKDGKAQRKEVEVGQSSGDYMEVKQGINAKDDVIVNPPDTLEVGSEVTVK
ncbi:efflux RND transporter periplasmic adaptor subunit [Metabacillus arenae]|uniref:Efflux RND transporter periplasmic adaptor subunit n=1 Tax=Metabacillus arenae TaxID=2771434 RepID=A0A926NIC9_9BACI|nr:efflux RND transporter periplasmic adaptor subunit [Metabacillus arenae]MBD1381315.1 efflux RND transporter periplasmic adaptor subunit [Metabacillus arenae]